MLDSPDLPPSEIFLSLKTETKEEEIEILNELLIRLEYSPTKIISNECPDFEIELFEKLIGVEVTKYFSDFTKKGSKSQKNLSEWKRFAEQLKTKLSAIESNLIYLYGAIHFHDKRVNYRELLNHDYINELVNLIESVGLKRTEEVTVKITAEGFPYLGKYIESIYFKDVYPEKDYLWWDGSLQSGSVISNKSAVQHIIDKKNQKAKKYKSNYFQKWLLIYAGGLGLADIFIETDRNFIRQGGIYLVELSDEQLLTSNKIASDYFTHIIIWDKFTENIFLIFPYFKKIFDCGENSIWVNHLPMKHSDTKSKNK
jgi:hypothetical protein